MESIDRSSVPNPDDHHTPQEPRPRYRRRHRWRLSRTAFAWLFRSLSAVFAAAVFGNLAAVLMYLAAGFRQFQETTVIAIVAAIEWTALVGITVGLFNVVILPGRVLLGLRFAAPKLVVSVVAIALMVVTFALTQLLYAMTNLPG